MNDVLRNSSVGRASIEDCIINRFFETVKRVLLLVNVKNFETSCRTCNRDTRAHLHIHRYTRAYTHVHAYAVKNKKKKKKKKKRKENVSVVITMPF